MTVTNNPTRTQKTTRPQPASTKPTKTNKPTTSRSVDGFEATKGKAPVVIKPTETVAQERSRRVGELQAKLGQVLRAEPPMTEAQLGQLLGSADDGNYDKAGTNQLDAETRRGLYAMMKCIHQIGRAREAISKGDAYLAKAYLDTDRSDEYTGAISFRDAASFNGMTGPEVLPFARAIIDITQGATPLLEQENMASLEAGKQIADYFESKDGFMSQGPMTQAVLRNVVRYRKELEQALAMPVTDGNRPEAIRVAKENLDNNVRALGPDPLKSLEENRRAVIEGLDKIGEVVGSIPTPITRGAGVLFRTAANGLELASGDIDRTQFLFKELAVLVDAVGGQATQKMRTLPKLMVDAGLEFGKSLAGELAKIPSTATESERRVATDKAMRVALNNAVMNVLTDLGVASMGDAGQKLSQELARVLTSSALGALGATGSEVIKVANDPMLSPEKRAAAVKDVMWKSLTNFVKTSSEGALEAVKNR